jgi:hypothetical protein
LPPGAAQAIRAVYKNFIVTVYELTSAGKVSQPVIVFQHPPDGLRAPHTLIAEDETCAAVKIFLIEEILAFTILAQMWGCKLRAYYARQLPGEQFIRFTVKVLVTRRTDRTHQLPPYVMIILTCCNIFCIATFF